MNFLYTIKWKGPTTHTHTHKMTLLKQRICFIDRSIHRLCTAVEINCLHTTSC